MNQKLTVVLSYLILLVACAEDETASLLLFGTGSYECYAESSQDTVTLARQLVGTWRWEYVSCFWTPKEDSNQTYRGLTVVFQKDQNLEVRQENQLIQTSSWAFEPNDSIYYELRIEPPVRQLYGRVELCDSVLTFEDSYRDGCTNIFRKIK